ncbi:MAG: ATP-dependent exoDNAse (exonuclease V) beta subunit, partial [Candidatus Promineifilaceae bacterium]
TAPAWVIGSIVHEALAQWRFPQQDEAQDENFDQWAAARAREYGLTDITQLKDGIKRAKIMLQRFRDSDVYVEIATADQRLHELPYVLGNDEGVIDLLFQKDGVWTIVDFKTDRIRSDEDQKATMERYAGQLERYVRAVEGLMGVRPVVLLVLLNKKGQEAGSG